MTAFKAIRLSAATSALWLSLACNAQDGAQAPAMDCRPEPASRPTVEPGSTFWRVHPSAEVRVKVRFHVAPSGVVTDVRPMPDNYHADYASETVKAVRKWTFKPFTCAAGGVWLQTHLVFVPPDRV